MSMEVSWYVPGRIIMVRAYADVTLEDITKANERILRMYETTDALVHMLVDQTEVTSFPSGINDCHAALSAMDHPYTGWTLVYGSSNMVTDFIAALIAQIGQIRYRKFAKRNEALEFLLYRDPSLIGVLPDALYVYGYSYLSKLPATA